MGAVFHVPVGPPCAEDKGAHLDEEGEDDVGEVHELSEGLGVLEEDESQPSQEDHGHEAHHYHHWVQGIAFEGKRKYRKRGRCGSILKRWVLRAQSAGMEE